MENIELIRIFRIMPIDKAGGLRVHPEENRRRDKEGFLKYRNTADDGTYV